ncbi:Cytochrome monooxygenase FUM15 [Penicillium malachiteum]|uniref:Cytochrome monooxygenase FUM15 n=1 Tax=Penicillium malachiteum TaxID=1324776 RepID=UPI0025473FB7|nr:Cytochrome monooxygenase FUM15 [Penicillium malachiteum]KAJ5721176.1 Cytochrome monooxygenase FUM15 [Penicillium malachiteum]
MVITNKTYTDTLFAKLAHWEFRLVFAKNYIFWIKDLPHEGLLRYYLVGNLEWVMPISSDALRAILVTKVYDFEKPEIMSYGMRKTLGNGILLVEGEEHKVQRKNLMPAFSYRHIKNLYPLFWSKSTEMERMPNSTNVSACACCHWDRNDIICDFYRAPTPQPGEWESSTLKKLQEQNQAVIAKFRSASAQWEKIAAGITETQNSAFGINTALLMEDRQLVAESTQKQVLATMTLKNEQENGMKLAMEAIDMCTAMQDFIDEKVKEEDERSKR